MLVRTEAAIAFCATVSGDDLELVKARLAADLERCAIVPVDQACLARAIEIGCGLDVRTLVALHLAAADRLPAPVRFLTFDRRQAEAAQALGFDVPDGRLPAEPPV